MNKDVGVVLDAAIEIQRSYTWHNVLRGPWNLSEPYQRSQKRFLPSSQASDGAPAKKKRKRDTAQPPPAVVSDDQIAAIASAHAVLCPDALGVAGHQQHRCEDACTAPESKEVSEICTPARGFAYMWVPVCQLDCRGQ